MKLLKSIGMCLAASVLWGSLTVAVAAKELRFTVNVPASITQAGKTLPKPKLLGKATLTNGVQLPAYQVFFSSGGSDEPYETVAPDSLNIDKKLDKTLSHQFVVYFFDDVWFLIPKNWHFVYAATGANGDSLIYFAPPKGQNGHFSAWSNNGGCYGCALSAASYYFKEADDLNQQNYDASPQYHKTIPPIKSVAIRPHVQAWRTTVNGQVIDGVAYFTEQNEADARVVQVSLPKAQNKLATPILNWDLAD